jgi:serine/threonine protein kinase
LGDSDVLSAGTKLGAYEIVTPLGAGGMGEVYRARERGSNRLVIVVQHWDEELKRLVATGK